MFDERIQLKVVMLGMKESVRLSLTLESVRDYEDQAREDIADKLRSLANAIENHENVTK